VIETNAAGFAEPCTLLSNVVSFSPETKIPEPHYTIRGFIKIVSNLDQPKASDRYFELSSLN